MAVSIFDKYGIKQVANVYFEALANDYDAGVYEGDIVLFLDTLKVSTIETAAETTDATGGWGNPKLISWDYGKTITVTLEDALMSLESLRFMLGGAIKKSRVGQGSDKGEAVWIHHTEQFKIGANGALEALAPHHVFKKTQLTPTATDGHPIRILNLTQGWRTQIVYDKDNTVNNSIPLDKTIWFYNKAQNVGSFTTAAASADDNPDIVKSWTKLAADNGDILRIFWDEQVGGENSSSNFEAIEVTISPNTFPGQYRVVGDTYIRNQKTGADEPFQFVINNAKVQSNVTLTLQAEGDPTTFSMTLEVLRDDAGGGDMMSLIRYNLDETSDDVGDDIGSITATTTATSTVITTTVSGSGS